MGKQGLKVLSHDFRKTRATNLYNTGEHSLIDVKAYLGHSSVTTTEKYVQGDLNFAGKLAAKENQLSKKTLPKPKKAEMIKSSVPTVLGKRTARN